MNTKFYKCCAVPQCRSSSKKTPDKLFIHVPRKEHSRKMWLRLARRESAFVSPKSKMYFCEDHFDLPNDMENYCEYHLMGSVSQVRMNAGCLPTKFGCQPDRKRRTDMKNTRSLPAKRQRLETIAELEKELAQTQSTHSSSMADVLPDLSPGADAWEKKVRIVKVKTEPEQEDGRWSPDPVHSSHNNNSDNERTIKQEPISTSQGVLNSEVVSTEIYYPAHREYVMIKVERPTTPEDEPTAAAPSSDPIFSPVCIKKEYDEDEESNDIGRKELSSLSINHKLPLNVEVKVEAVNEPNTISESDDFVRPKLKVKDKHFFNIKLILECTNATLIRSQEDVGYTCYFCENYYQDPADLKDHATNAHSVINQMDIIKRYVADYTAKLDITSLHCKLCSSNIDSLEDLMTHLNDAHNKNLFLDIKNQILPFKFNSNVHKCCICEKDFNKFRSLQSHVQTHYRNYECSECDLAFISRMKLVQHLRTHRVGSFQCRFCPKEFTTIPRRKIHENYVHDQRLMRKCGLCDERFKYMRQKELHVIKVHGVQPTNKCKMCDKVFLTRDSLSVHVRRDHLKVRNARCTECDMCFFTSSELRVHMMKHTNEAKYVCEVCHRSYKHKNYLNDHMRMHSDDYRHKCERCDMVFVQKTGLRTHLRAQHGEKYTPG